MDTKHRKIRPLHNLVLVDPDAQRDEKMGSFWIPETYRTKTANDSKTLFRKSNQYTTGTVEAVGPGARRRNDDGELEPSRDPVDVKVGDRIVYRRSEASPIGLEGDTRVLVYDVSIVGRQVSEEGT